MTFAGSSDCAEGACRDDKAEHHAQPYTTRVHDELERPFAPARNDTLAHTGRRELPDGPPQGHGSGDGDAPASRPRHCGHADECQQWNSERHDDVTECAEDGAVGGNENQSAERRECKPDADAREATLPGEASFQVDDATRHDPPATRFVVTRRRG